VRCAARRRGVRHLPEVSVARGTIPEDRTMAEIRVEQERKRGLGWLWLLILLILVAAAVWYFTNGRVVNTAPAADSVHTTGALRSAPAVMAATAAAGSTREALRRA
jgi:hypothetical protein